MAQRAAGAVTLVVGPEELLAERAVAEVKQTVRAELARSGGPAGDDGTVNVRDVLAAETSADDLREMLSPSLFDDHVVVVLRAVHDAGEDLTAQLQEALADPPGEATLVLVHNGKAKGKRLLDTTRKAGAVEVACAEIKTRRDKLRFLSAEMRRHRRRASEEALETLLEAVGGDVRTLAAACSQLAADTDGVIDVDVVGRYYAGIAEASGFAVADLAIEGRTGEALQRLRWAVQSGLDPVPIVAALATGLRNVVRVASAGRASSSADLARALAMPPWKVDVVRRQLRGWDAAGAAAALSAVAEADAQVKGGGADPVYAVERAVVAITSARIGG